jgi:hypothetical protein
MRSNRGLVPVAAVPFAVLAVAGLAATLYTGYLIVRGPFLGGPRLAPQPLMWALGGFVAGIVVLAFGANALSRVR